MTSTNHSPHTSSTSRPPGLRVPSPLSRAPLRRADCEIRHEAPPKPSDPQIRPSDRNLIKAVPTQIPNGSGLQGAAKASGLQIRPSDRKLIKAVPTQIPNDSAGQGEPETSSFSPSSTQNSISLAGAKPKQSDTGVKKKAAFAEDIFSSAEKMERNDSRRRAQTMADYRTMPPISEPHKASSGSHVDDTSFAGCSDDLRSATPRGNTLTVEGTWKVEAAVKRKEKVRDSGVRLLAALKWLATIAMATTLLASLVTVKLCVLVLSSQLWNARAQLSKEGPAPVQQVAWRRYSGHFIVLYIFLTIPALLNWLRAVWYGLLDKTVPWPKGKVVCVAVLSAGLESLGLSLMGYFVLGSYRAPLSLLLLGVPLLVPAVNMAVIVRNLRRLGLIRVRVVVCFVVGGVCLLTGTTGAVVTLAMTEKVDKNVWHLVVAVVCLSLAWLPSLQDYISAIIVTHNDQVDAEQTYLPYNTYSEDSTNDLTYRLPGTSRLGNMNNTLSSDTSSISNSSNENVTSDVTANPAWKTAFVMNTFRLVFILLVSALLYILDSGQSVDKVLTSQTHHAFLEAWDLSKMPSSTVKSLGIGSGAALLAYVFAFAACHMNMTLGALLPPLVLATPLALVAVTVSPVCDVLLVGSTCSWEEHHVVYVVLTAVPLVLGHLLVFGWYLVQNRVLLQREDLVFCVPGYNGVSLDTWLTLNRRRDVTTSPTTERRKFKKTKVYICTTMYREDEEEMRQLLESIRRINEARTSRDRCSFESHVIFDNGTRQRDLSEFALTLIGLLEGTLGLEPKTCTKVITPYGQKLSWALPGPRGDRMSFNIHLKDNLLVKNKKRWSQVMYMSYVLDFLRDGDAEDYILTTDADVVFTPDSVEALLDLMTRDSSIGAVCARTHPMGSGPLVWYQVFEYAIGHWLQKAAEHVLGSVLCAPGCFSVYRCRALVDVLPKYARRVESAFDFLTKDMGEDRWLCTLLVQSGWRIEYCAASENSTNCPSHFEEFYKQRRRWIASTLANLMLIVKEWKYVHQLNQRVSVFFLLYQGLLLFSTLIGPSTVVLVVSGGLSYAWDVHAVATVVLQLIACVCFAALCVNTSQKVQLKVAKMYTFLYAVVMTAVVVGTAEQIVNDINAGSPSGSGPGNDTVTTISPHNHISVNLPMSVTTLYFTFLVGIFVVTGLLHPREVYCLLHGIWYLLCVPSGYLVLTIYSICNITDSSWGTREQASNTHIVKSESWQQRLQSLFYGIFFCCKAKGEADVTRTAEPQLQRPNSMINSVVSSVDDPTVLANAHDDVMDVATPSEKSSLYTMVNPATPTLPFAFDEVQDETEPVQVEDWLPREMRGRYAPLFKKHGFDSTLFIAGMTETDLRRIGVTTRGHLHYLLAEIDLIPAFDIEYKVPTNVSVWLEEIGLSMYRDNFRRNHIQQPKEMEILKSFGRREIERELGIVKDGHIKRLMYAISMLREPSDAQQQAIRMRQLIEEAPINYLKEFNIGEYDFWEALKEKCLQPDLKAFGLEEEVKVKLANLRNDWLMIMAVTNVLWLILISTLASVSSLTVLGANPVGLAFLAVFGLLFAIQFLSMMLHRLYTLSHYVARTPYRFGSPLKKSTFQPHPGRFADCDDSMDHDAMERLRNDTSRALQRLLRTKRKAKKPRAMSTPNLENTERTPLISSP